MCCVNNSAAAAAPKRRPAPSLSSQGQETWKASPSRTGHPRYAGNAVGLHRKLIARKYDGNKQRGPGRPRTQDEIQQWVVRMATENRDWGYRRIQGALANLAIR